MRHVSLPVLISLGLATAVAAQPLTITSSCLGNAEFRLTSIPATSTAIGEGVQDLRCTGAAGQDQLFGNWWWYRAAADTREHAFNNSATSGFVGAVVGPKGDSAVLRWVNVDGKGFNAELTYRIYSTGVDSGVLSECLMISNPSTTQLNLTVFNYADFDVCGAAGDSSAILPAPSPGIQQVITDATCTVRCFFLGCGQPAYQTGPWATIRTLLNNATIDNLANIGSPFGPGDFSSAYQWRMSIAPGGNETVYEALACGQAVPCCDPATIRPYCVAKAGTNGLPRWGDNPLFVCGQTELKVLNGLTGSSPIVFVGAAPVCIPVPPFGTLAISPILATFNMPAFDTTGVSRVCLTVPCNQALCGLQLFMQAWFPDGGAAGFPIAHTEGCGFTLGSL